MSEPTRFVVLASPRTGSNWLCTLLGAHPAVLCHHELFNPKGIHYALPLRDTDFSLGTLEDRRVDPLALLARAWSTPLGRAAVGFKLNWSQDARVFAAVLGDPGLRKVLTYRRNRVKTFISEQLALRTGRWESYLHRSERGETPKIRVEADDLWAHVARNEAYTQGLRQAVRASGAPLHEVAYEDLGLPDTLDGLFTFLGLPRLDRPPVGATFKRTPTDLRDVIENHEELARQVAGTPLDAELFSAQP